jgi:hypothetical protein
VVEFLLKMGQTDFRGYVENQAETNNMSVWEVMSELVDSAVDYWIDKNITIDEIYN